MGHPLADMPTPQLNELQSDRRGGGFLVSQWGRQSVCRVSQLGRQSVCRVSQRGRQSVCRVSQWGRQ